MWCGEMVLILILVKSVGEDRFDYSTGNLLKGSEQLKEKLFYIKWIRTELEVEFELN